MHASSQIWFFSQIARVNSQKGSSSKFGNPLAIYGVSQARRPETPKKSEINLLGPLAPGSLEESAKSPEKVWEKVPKGPDIDKTFRDFSRLSRGPASEGPGRLFFRLFRAFERPL